tara:strand:+ start:370 stop:510 length:141 start_codon:yes stop_codon:yes gene_type:complete
MSSHDLNSISEEVHQIYIEIEENEKLQHEKFAEENNVSLDEDELAF